MSKSIINMYNVQKAIEVGILYFQCSIPIDINNRNFEFTAPLQKNNTLSSIKFEIVTITYP